MKQEVKKHVAAIHVNGELSLLERKISNVLLVNAYDNLLVVREHTIPINVLCQLLGFESNNINALKDALQKIVGTLITWDIMKDDGKNEWGVSTLLASGEIKSGICTYEYSASLARKLYNPDIYAKINLNIQRKFSSVYAITIYENCLRYKGVGSTGWIDLIVFKKLIGLDNSDYYESFKHLNLKVIKPAIKEINEQSDIIIEAEFKKEKRRVIAIRFIVNENPQLTLIQEGKHDDTIKFSLIYKRIIQYGISERLAIQWINQYGEDFLNQKLDYTDAQEKLGCIKGSASGFLVSAVTNDYQPPEEQKKKRVQARKKQATLAQREEREQAQEKKQQAKSERQKVEDYLASLSQTQLEALQAAFLHEHEGNPVVMRQHGKNGFKSAAVQALFREYARQRR